MTYAATKCDDTVLTSAASGVARLEVDLVRQSVSDWRFYFPGLEGVVGRATPSMVTIPDFLTGSWSKHWLVLLRPH